MTAVSRRRFLTSGAGVGAAAALSAPGQASAQTGRPPGQWDREADVVVIGSGAVGLPAAITAREAGSSVILVEAESHIGGHAIVSGGTVPLGGGTSAQRKYGIADSPDLLFRDLTDWSVVEPNGFPDYRYNDREIVRAFADHSAETFEWLVAHGVVFVEKAPDAFDGVSSGNSAPRAMHAAAMNWPMVQTGKSLDPDIQSVTSTGAGLMRPLQAAAEKAGVDILLEHRMEATVARYNAFVDSGVDADFGKPKPQYKIAKPPFYAGWSTPVVHDTRAGLRITPRCQVVDMNGGVIPGLYCGGEAAGGFSQHGLARAACQGLIAGVNAAAERI